MCRAVGAGVTHDAAIWFLTIALSFVVGMVVGSCRWGEGGDDDY